MAPIVPHRRVLLVMAAFSRYPRALDFARSRTTEVYGPLALESARFDHNETTFYESTMGTSLKKTFFAFERLIDPAELPRLKHETNALEAEIAGTPFDDQAPVTRPLNLDPGYLTEAKLVLASTKDRDHRIYLDQGIYAEGTLFFRAGSWQCRPWTYPDYQRADYHQFFADCREYLRKRYRDEIRES